MRPAPMIMRGLAILAAGAAVMVFVPNHAEAG